MLSDKELLDTFKLEIINARQLILTFLKTLSQNDQDRLAKLVVASVLEIFNKNPNTTFNLLIDVTALKFLPTAITKNATDTYKGFSKNTQLHKAAIVGAGLLFKVATIFLMPASKRTNLQWFSNKEEALAWLKKN